MAAQKTPDDDKLKRLIYLCNVDAKYYCGSPEKKKPHRSTYAGLLNSLLKSSHENLLKVLEAAYSDKFLPHKVQVFNILATLLTLEDATETIKTQICQLAENLCKSDKDVFQFVKAVVSTQQRPKKKPTTCVRKSVARFYYKKSAEDLAKSYVFHKSLNGWRQKDIIKFFHIKSDTPLKNIVINHILFGETNEDVSSEAKPLIELMKKSQALNRTKDPKIAVPLIVDLKATINQVETCLRKSAEVWNAVLPNTDLHDVLQCLPKLYKLGFLKKDSPTQLLISEVLTNSRKIKSSGIHPIEVFMQMKNFEKGGRPLDPQLLHHLKTEKKISDEEYEKIKATPEIKCPSVMSSLQKCMNLSCNNVQPFGKRYLITIDTTDKMDTACVGCKNITGIEAAAAFAWLLLKVEKDVTVAVFNEKEVSVVNLDKKAHLYEHVQKLRENKSKYLVLAAPIEWASSQKKHFDIFINFIHHREYYATIPKEVRDKMTSPVEALEKYRKKVNLQNAKLVTFCLSSPKMVVSQGQTNVLDIAGIDSAVPRVLEAFCRNNFV